jgi:hypothetical protein
MFIFPMSDLCEKCSCVVDKNGKFCHMCGFKKMDREKRIQEGMTQEGKLKRVCNALLKEQLHPYEVEIVNTLLEERFSHENIVLRLIGSFTVLQVRDFEVRIGNVKTPKLEAVDFLQSVWRRY